MVFSSMTFLWVFLPILFVFYFICPKKLKNYILLIFSLLFYAWGEPRYIILMLVSILINYILGIFMSKKIHGKGSRKLNKTKNKVILITGILFNLAFLGFYKYAGFLLKNIDKVFGLSFSNDVNIVLPIGISFYTFQILSYIIDLYREDIKVQRNISKLALYISFFPQLIAGPIVKYHDIEKQLENRTESVEKFAYGIKRFVYGLGKKVLLANTLALIADSIFDVNVSTLNAPSLWLGIIAYTLQIFFDFSGYSDMAIGLGSMFGFTFIENFNLPYLSSSITEFWRRWHISLSTWFKEYLYIPLGGNRKGQKRTYFNLWMVFLATGIWHGAAWTFVIWGIFHGLFMFIERLGFKKFLDKHAVIGHVYTLLVVMVGWIFFRANSISDALKYIFGLFNFGAVLTANIVHVLNARSFFVIIVAIMLSGILQTVFEKHKNNKLFVTIKKVEPIFLLIILTFSIAALVSSTYNPFIYFRF